MRIGGMFRIVLAAFLAIAAVQAQDDGSSAVQRQQALEALAQQIRDNDAKLSDALAQPARDAARIEALREADAQLHDRFAALASGLDVAQVRSPKVSNYELQSEVTRLLKPLVRALSEATCGWSWSRR